MKVNKSLKILLIIIVLIFSIVILLIYPTNPIVLYSYHPVAEISQKFDDGSAVYYVESGNAVDVRKPIFYMLAQNSWPILSLEFAGANLEDIFISVVDEAEAEEHGKKPA